MDVLLIKFLGLLLLSNYLCEANSTMISTSPIQNTSSVELFETMDSSASTSITNLSVTALSPFGALVTWRSLSQRATFDVSATSNCMRKMHCTERPLISISQDVGNPSWYSALISNLPTWENTSINVRACLDSSFCGNPEETWVVLKAQWVPEPVIVGIGAYNSTSFYVDWTYDSHERAHIFDGFEIRYCKFDHSGCFVKHTHKGHVTVTHQEPETHFRVNVGAVLNSHGWGKNDLGCVATAIVSTWADVPSRPTVDVNSTSAMSVDLSWMFVNSTVSVIQIAKKNAPWINCTRNGSICSTNMDLGWTSLQENGTLTLTNLQQATHYMFFVRGCNENGCGAQATVNVSTLVAVPAAPELRLPGLAIDRVVIEWTIKEGPVNLIQVSKNNKKWLNCTSHNETCTSARTFQGQSTLNSGIITFKHLQPASNHWVSVRGCNDYGCGHPSEIEAPTDITGLSKPTDLRITPLTKGTALVEWKSPEEPAIPRMGYEVTWLCQPGDPRSIVVSDSRATIIDLPTEASCKVWVASYNLRPSGYILRSLKVEVSLRHSFRDTSNEIQGPQD
ncbi:uncharacterized protein ISCGN_013694 [Ixodes scapularis]